MKRHFTEINPRDAVDICLPRDDIIGPVDEEGEPCPWPWDPIQLKGVPMGQYHCPYCGMMVMAGMDHGDYTGLIDPSPEYPDGHVDLDSTLV